MNTQTSSLEAIHWYDAAQLIAFSDSESLWRAVLPKETRLAQIRQLARECLNSEVRSEAGAQFQRRLSQGGSFEFDDFVKHWFSAGHTHERPTDEVVGILFFLAMKDFSINSFFADALGVANSVVAMNACRDSSADEDILQKVTRFEVNIYRGGTDEWERRFLQRSVALNPFIDFSYPVTKGYLDKTMFEAARVLFSKSFGRDSLKSLTQAFENRFGQLRYPEAWEGLAA